MPEARLEYVRLYGFGQFVDWPYPRELAVRIGPHPNGEYRESLGPAAQSVSRAALWGTEPAWAGDGTNDVPLSEQGCSGRAEEWASTHDTNESPAWLWIQDARNTLDETTLHDARVTGSLLTSTTCMYQAGFPEVTGLWEGDNAFAYPQTEHRELLAASGKSRVADLEELGRLEIDRAVAEELVGE